MTYMAKLLIYLNPDVADLYSIGLYLYGKKMDIDERHKKARAIISNVQYYGWDVAGDAKSGYVLSEEHYELIQAHQRQLSNRKLNQRLTPDNMRKWAA